MSTFQRHSVNKIVIGRCSFCSVNEKKIVSKNSVFDKLPTLGDKNNAILFEKEYCKKGFVTRTTPSIY